MGQHRTRPAITRGPLLASGPQAIYRHGQLTLGRRCDAELYYVVPDADWAVDRVGDYITRLIRARFGWPAHVTSAPHLLVGHVLHYGELWSFVNSLNSRRNASNIVVTTVFHGDRRDEFPEMKAAMDKLIAYAHIPARIVTTCRIMEERLSRWEIPAAKVVRIPLGVDLALFQPVSAEHKGQLRRQFGVPEHAVCLGSFQKDGQGWQAGLSPKLEKGPDIFLNVVQRLSRHYPLFVLLTGPARGYVSRGLDALGVPYRHDFVHDLRRLPDYYGCLDVYVVTSREEGGPQSVLEAMATGVPLVSTRMGMAADVIQHGYNGLLAESEDVETLAELVSRLVETPGLRTELSEQGVESIRPYDWETIAARYYHELYRPLLDERAS
ncbi:MAG TPA: glycosyltransferase family 4 protein [Vicinamibacterales bacterium]|nr:glycosyltransferase family 4 protein [Vicinamibacterales bacterium]